METTIQKWGNSLAIRIPINIAKEVRFKRGSYIDIQREQNKLILVHKKKKLRLVDLLAKINNQNLHTEIDTGETIGNENW